MGTSDGWTDITPTTGWTGTTTRRRRATWYRRPHGADRPRRQPRPTLALGFGAPGRRRAAPPAVAGPGLRHRRRRYAAGWHDYLAGRSRPRERGRARAELYDVSLMVLAASEDKTFRGGGIASPSMAWVWGDPGLLRALPPRVVARPLPGGQRSARRRRPRGHRARGRLPVEAPAEAGRLLPAELEPRRHAALAEPAARRGRLPGDHVPGSSAATTPTPGATWRARSAASSRTGPTPRSAGRTPTVTRRPRSPPRSRR